MRISRDKVKWIKVIMIVSGVLCAVGSVLRSVKMLEMNDYAMTAADGVYIYSLSGIIAVVLPLIIVYGNMVYIKYDFNYPCMLRQKSRYSLWYRRISQAYADCVIVTFLGMIAGGIASYIVSGTVTDFYSLFSVCRGEFAAAGMPVPENMNMILMFVVSAILNSLELFFRVSLGLLIFWLGSSQVLAVICTMLMTWLPTRMTKYEKIIDFKVEYGAYYTELCSFERAAESFLLIMAGICVVMLIAQILIPRKDYIQK